MEKNENKQKDATIDPFKKFKFPWATIERFVYQKLSLRSIIGNSW